MNQELRAARLVERNRNTYIQSSAFTFSKASNGKPVRSSSFLNSDSVYRRIALTLCFEVVK